MKSLLLRRHLAILFLVGSGIAVAQAPFSVEVVTEFDEPWAVNTLPSGDLLVTERKGNLYIVSPSGERSRATLYLPDVRYGGQGGLGDVALHPNYPENGIVYLSYAEAGVGGTSGAAVARGRLDTSGRAPALRDVKVIWRQYPKRFGMGHYGHRLLFDANGYLWVTSGDRQQFTPAQDMQSNMGKVLRLRDDGSVPHDNPFLDYYAEEASIYSAGVFPQIWSLGHRNPLGIDADADGRIWVIEMGPLGGDELNLIERGANYGYPEVSNGDHYDRREIPNHDTRPEFNPPAVWWTPTVSPGDLHIVRGAAFGDWRGQALVAGLSSRAIIRVELRSDGSALEVERYDMGARIRSIAEAADGTLWVLEDDRGSSQGRLLKLTPTANDVAPAASAPPG